MKLNKKIMSIGVASMLAIGVFAVTGITVSAHDPVGDHKHPHVDEVQLTMEDKFKKAFEDAGYDNYAVKCDKFDGRLSAYANGMLMSEASSRLHGQPWSFEQDMSDVEIYVEAGASAEICAGSGVRSGVFGEGF